MTSLSETFKLAFLGNIIKNKYVGKPQPVRLGRKEGDALMKQLVNEVFKKLLDEKKVTTIRLMQYYNPDVLPITTNFVAKFSKNNDVLFNRISLLRLISVCNLFLQDNNVGTLKRVQKEVDYEPDDRVVQLLQNMQISRGNQDVVEAIEKQQISTVELLTNVKTAFESEMNKVESGVRSAIEEASAARKKEAADLKENLQRYIEEMMKRQTSNKRLENGDEVFDDKNSDELSAKENAKRENKTLEYSQKVKDENKVKKQFDNNVDTVKFNKGQYIITLLTDKSELFYSITKFDGLNQEDQSYLEKKITIDNDLQLTITNKLKKVEELIGELTNLRKAPSIDMKKALELVEASNKILDDLEYIHPKRSEIRSKRIKLLHEQRELKSNQKQNKMIRPKDNEEKVAEYYSFDEYSDDFEAASSNMSIDETHFLKVIFNTLKNPGVDHVTNSLIDYLESGLQMNKGEYKRSYKQFYNTWQFEDDVVMESDKDVVKTLFSNINEIDFDDDYLCIMGGDTKLSWISYMRIAVYEKYRLIDYIENFNGYDIRGCMREALSNFIYDYCYMSTLLFETVAE